MDDLHGFVPVMADVFVKFFMLFFGDIILGLGPDGFHGVEGLVFSYLSIGLSNGFPFGILNNLIFRDGLAFFHVHDHRIGHKIRMLFDNVLEGIILGKILVPLFGLF